MAAGKLRFLLYSRVPVFITHTHGLTAGDETDSPKEVVVEKGCARVLGKTVASGRAMGQHFRCGWVFIGCMGKGAGKRLHTLGGIFDCVTFCTQK